MGSSFHFTIEDPVVLDQALLAFETQAEVIVHYKVEIISSMARSERRVPHFVTKIELTK